MVTAALHTAGAAAGHIVAGAGRRKLRNRAAVERNRAAPPSAPQSARPQAARPTVAGHQVRHNQAVPLRRIPAAVAAGSRRLGLAGSRPAADTGPAGKGPAAETLGRAPEMRPGFPMELEPAGMAPAQAQAPTMPCLEPVAVPVPVLAGVPPTGPGAARHPSATDCPASGRSSPEDPAAPDPAHRSGCPATGNIPASPASPRFVSLHGPRPPPSSWSWPVGSRRRRRRRRRRPLPSTNSIMSA